METLIRCRVLRHLIWVCTVSQLSFYGFPDYSGLTLTITICRRKVCHQPQLGSLCWRFMFVTLSTLSKIFSRRHFVIFFSYFSQETGFYISCKLSKGFDRSWKSPHWRQFLWNGKSCFLGKIRKCHQFIACWISLEGNRAKSCNEFIINIQTLSPTNWTCHLSDRFTTLWSSVVCRTRSLRSTIVTYNTGTPSCGPLQSPTRQKNICLWGTI